MAATSYEFLGTPVTVEVDDPAVLAVFDAMYGRFRTDSPAAGALRFAVRSADASGPPRVESAEGADILMDSDLTASHAYMMILRGVLHGIGGHFMVHAGSVERAGGAVLLVGGSGFGKTTLILKLIERGFGFYSDEFACLDRGTWRVHPFPRAVGLREKTLDLFPALREQKPVQVKNIGRGHKYLLDALALPGARLAAPAPVSHVLLIDAGEAAVPEGTILLDIALTEPRPDLVEALAEVDGVTLARESQVEGYVVLRYQLAEANWERAAAICEADKRGVLYFERIYGERPDFSRPVAFEPARKSEVAMMMFRNLRNRRGCFGTDEAFRARASVTYMEMVRLTRPAVCLRMTPGDLDEMADRIEALVESDRTGG